MVLCWLQLPVTDQCNATLYEGHIAISYKRFHTHTISVGWGEVGCGVVGVRSGWVGYDEVRPIVVIWVFTKCYLMILSVTMEKSWTTIDFHCKNFSSLILSCHTWNIPKNCTSQISEFKKTNFYPIYSLKILSDGGRGCVRWGGSPIPLISVHFR